MTIIDKILCRYGVLPDSLTTGEGEEKDDNENKIMEEVARCLILSKYQTRLSKLGGELIKSKLWIRFLAFFVMIRRYKTFLVG